MVPAWRYVEVRCDHHSDHPREAVRAGKALFNMLDDLRSVQTGTPFRVSVEKPPSLREAVSDGLFSGEWIATLILPDFSTGYTQTQLVEQVVVAPMDRPSEGLEVTR